jgi:sodium/potassium-transporting ATPase subunit alpha
VKITEHLLEIHEVCNKLKTNSETGLTESEAEFRLKRDGPNAFTPPKQTAWWILYLREMTGGFALLLWFASIASFVAYFIEKEPQDVSNNGINVFTMI